MLPAFVRMGRVSSHPVRSLRWRFDSEGLGFGRRHGELPKPKSEYALVEGATASIAQRSSDTEPCRMRTASEGLGFPGQAPSSQLYSGSSFRVGDFEANRAVYPLLPS